MSLSKDADWKLKKTIADKEDEQKSKEERGKSWRDFKKWRIAKVGKYQDDFEELQDDYFNEINDLDGEIDEYEELEKNWNWFHLKKQN